ncbi:M23 family metallopeptidase [Clavibacter michiganensis]|uniref:Membrane bound metalloendopeptidase,family M23 n=5 Tax=Clavibacter michiganensis TaxID=28447 RepID=A5CUU5_CLAM3|nr:M23 family metallopeptidase [Clavibacter michiganensis]MDO4073751.1 M23 family metallopeptidase [Clavibacter michiganensis]MWJ35862.1 M23 family peptidase [Clavibacter michiganensis subsp. michiganensis]MWJ47095.1 M23 family peptidase [Clavibacter michiganensis subsp. michiganensis]OUE14292.1 Murein DD-endopeptidase MepM [Clavibacter michiganensis subsp. michiganensis]CAN02883.1 putative membrane bound metalloendopeptidase,family M23 [Clavibacter michiganensis subsp. michiganensis NCPPB 382
MLTPDETAGTVYPTRRERREAERRAAEAQQAPEAQEAPLDDSVAQPAAEPAQVAPAPRALHIPVEAPEAPRAHLPADAEPASAAAAETIPLATRARRLRAASASAPESRRSSYVPAKRASVPAAAPHARVRGRRVPASSRPALAAPAPEAAAGRRRSNASRGLTLLTMAFVATVTIATSLPSSAFLTGQDMAQANVVTDAPATSIPSQSVALSAAPAATVVGGTDDAFTATTPQQIMLAQTSKGAGAFTNDINGTIQWPFASGVPISGVFGHRIAPCSNGCSSDHKGVDFAPGMGAPIQAIADGVVREAVNSDTGLGVHLVIDHVIDGQLVTSVYGHMLPGSLRVKAGDPVKVGTQIGQVGNTGASTGPHLHLEIHIADGTPVDPFAWLQEHAN